MVAAFQENCVNNCAMELARKFFQSSKISILMGYQNDLMEVKVQR